MLPAEWEAAALCSRSSALKAHLYIVMWGPFPASGRERVGRNGSVTQVKNIACSTAPEVFLCPCRLGERGCWSCQAHQRTLLGSPAKGRGAGGSRWGAEACKG